PSVMPGRHGESGGDCSNRRPDQANNLAITGAGKTRDVVQLKDLKNIPPSGPWPRLLLIPAGCFSQPGSVEHIDSWESKASPRQLVRLACFQGRIWNSYRICAIGIEGFRLTQATSDRHKLMLSAASYLPLHKTGGAPTASGRIKPTVSGYLFGS